MKIYSDKNLTKEVTIIDFGTVEAGNKEEFTYYVVNDSKARLESLNFEINNKEVNISSYPKQMKANETSKLVIKWSPSVTIKEGLKANLNVTGNEIYT